MGVLHRICKESPRPIQEINPEIPLWLSAIICRLHAKNPAKRYASAAEVAEVLQRQLARVQSPSGTIGLSLTEVRLVGPRAWLSRHGDGIGVWVGAAAAAIVVSAVLIEKFMPPNNVRWQPTDSVADPNRAAVAAMVVAREDSQSDRAWQESLGDLNSQIDRLEDEQHAAAPSPDPIAAEIAAIENTTFDALAPLFSPTILTGTANPVSSKLSANLPENVNDGKTEHRKTNDQVLSQIRLPLSPGERRCARGFSWVVCRRGDLRALLTFGQVFAQQAGASRCSGLSRAPVWEVSSPA